MDLLFFVGVVMSLLAIAFSYDAVSGEKELGTLKLLMSYSAPPRLRFRGRFDHWGSVTRNRFVVGLTLLILPMSVGV